MITMQALSFLMVTFSRPLYIVLGIPKNLAALHKLQDYYNTERMGIGISIQATPKTRWRGLWVGWERKPRQLTPSFYSGSPAAADPGIRGYGYRGMRRSGDHVFQFPMSE